MTSRVDAHSPSDAAPRPIPGATPRIPAVQGLRAVAIVLVLAYHAALPVPGGFVGVDLFFVISGYVITGVLLRRHAASGRVGFADFYRRRVRRLLPALAAVLTVTLLASMVIESPIESQSNTALSGLGASVWLPNVALYVVTAGYFSPDAQYAVLLHTWSLGVEEQFYLVFPLALALGFWISRRGRLPLRPTLAVLVGIASIASLAVSLWLTYGNPGAIPAPRGFAFFMPFGRAWEFGVGVLVALLPSAWLSRRATATVAAPLGAALVLGSALLLDDRMVFPGVISLAPVIGGGLLIAGVATGQGGVARLLSRRWPVAIGDLSYSLYLWHWPFIAFAIALAGDSVPVRVVACALSFPVARYLYVAVEQRFRHPRPSSRPAWQLVVACVSVPVVASLALATGARAGWGVASIQDAQQQIAPNTYVGDVCDGPRVRLVRGWVCQRAGTGAGQPVALVGDSNAQQLAVGLDRAAREQGRSLAISVTPGCGFVALDFQQLDGLNRCAPRTEHLLAWFDERPPTVVFIASANVYVDDDTTTIITPAGRRVVTTAAKAQVWEESLRATFHRLRSAGHTVVQVPAIPHFLDDGVAWSPSRCSMPQLLIRSASCGPTQSLAEGNRAHAAGLAAESAAATKEKVRQLDVRDLICPGGTCAAQRDGFWVYREGMHISEGMSARLAPTFAAALGA